MADDVFNATADIDLYDHEWLQIREIGRKLAEAKGSHRDIGGYAQEVFNRYLEAGFLVRVAFGAVTYGGETTYMPMITIVDRMEDPGEFDHELQGHEVRTNIRELDQPDVAPAKPVAMPGRGSLWTPKGS